MDTWAGSLWGRAENRRVGRGTGLHHTPSVHAHSPCTHPARRCGAQTTPSNPQ